ncbi:MAG: MarR family transcriptional regulator [Halomonas sp.]|nr:MarR family transcriptional regulator [Halomonas sp.]|tara:strand:- start:1337 stop:1882 length:546 start_codon:yes stop_codon:yes gene_type:complete
MPLQSDSDNKSDSDNPRDLPSGENLDRDARALYDALNQLIRVHQFRDRDRICGYDLSVAQCYALETLVHQGPLRLQGLASVMYLDKSTASRVVDALVRKGHVDRIADPADRRAALIRPTVQGEALYQTIRADLIAEERAMLEGLTPDMRQAALTLIRQLTQAAHRRCGPGPGGLSPVQNET